MTIVMIIIIVESEVKILSSHFDNKNSHIALENPL